MRKFVTKIVRGFVAIAIVAIVLCLGSANQAQAADPNQATLVRQSNNTYFEQLLVRGPNYIVTKVDITQAGNGIVVYTSSMVIKNDQNVPIYTIPITDPNAAMLVANPNH